MEVDKDPPRAVEERTTSKKMTFPTLLKFNGDGDAFNHWLHKFTHYAELEQWTERQKLLQLELYLSGRADQVYKVLPTSAKDTFSKAVESLKKRLQPVANEALLSTQLMKRKPGNLSICMLKSSRHCLKKAPVNVKGWTLPPKSYLRGMCLSRDYPSSGRRNYYPQLLLLQMHFIRPELQKNKIHYWVSCTVDAHQTSRCHADLPPRVMALLVERQRTTRGRPKFRDEQGRKGVTSVIVHSTEPTNVHSIMLHRNHLAVIVADELQPQIPLSQ